MKRLAKILIIASPIIFIVNFLTLLNLNFTKNQQLQSLGAFVAVISIIFFLLGVVINFKKVLIKKDTPAQQKQPQLHPKRLMGIFIIIWLLILYPMIEMSQLDLIHKISEEFPNLEGNIGAFTGMMVFLPLVMVATIYPGLYFSPLIVFPFILLPLSIYFIFSHSWHKILDVALLILAFFCMIGQVVLPRLIGM